MPLRTDFRLRGPGGRLGEYTTGDRTAVVFLRRVRQVCEKFAGAPATDDMLAKTIVETLVHEELHFLVRSGAHNEDERVAREHRAISRLLCGAGYDFTY